MQRRRFIFWLSLGIFSLGERFSTRGFDGLAARLIKTTEFDEIATAPTHWRATDNATWRWFEQETLIDDQWVVTGITTPVHKKTGERYTGHTGYLDESLVPDEVRFPRPVDASGAPEEDIDKAAAALGVHRPDPERRARHGRPPSVWLRSLRADEIRIWLKTIEVPEAGVSGMTFFEHLTRDHSFDPDRITGLTEDEQAKLHAAAHHGY